MNTLDDKNMRLALLERYLDADTTVEEERTLRDYYSVHAADSDEAAAARLLTLIPDDALLPPEGISSLPAAALSSSDRDLLSPEGASSLPAAALSSSDRDLLSPEGAAEFDRILVGGGRRRRWLWAGGIVAAAACVGIFLLFSPFRRTAAPEPDGFTPIEIAEQLQTLINLNILDIESITARPAGDGVVITATQKDGTESTYLMMKDGTDGSYRLLALNQ